MKTLWERFWGKVQKTDKCWIWTSSKNPNGCATFSYYGKPEQASRVAWMMTYGLTIPKGIFICHTCDNRACVRPSHLFTGTHQDNMRDMVQKGRAKGTFHYGETNGSAKLTTKQVRTILKSTASGVSLATDFRVSKSLICLIRQRKSWKHLTVK
jgi:hypothetical protein